MYVKNIYNDFEKFFIYHVLIFIKKIIILIQAGTKGFLLYLYAFIKFLAKFFCSTLGFALVLNDLLLVNKLFINCSLLRSLLFINLLIF